MVAPQAEIHAHWADELEDRSHRGVAERMMQTLETEHRAGSQASAI
jgi:hypothetical protein